MAENMSVSFVIGATIAAGFAGAFKTAVSETNRLASVAAKAHAKERELMQQSSDLNRIWEKGQISVEHHKEALSQLASQMDKVRIAQRAVAKQKELGSKYELYKQRRNNAVQNIMAAGATAYAISLPVREAIEMESSMSDVAKVVDMTDDEFSSMKDSIIEMSTRIPISAKGIAAIVASAGQAGIAKPELLRFAEDAAKMGVAFDVSAEQAGDMMAKWRTAFKMGQTDVVALADKINYLSNNTASTAAQISDVVTRIGPLGEVGGMASGEIAALGASMVGSGVQSEVAATGIKNLILGMTAGAGVTKAQAAAFDALGLSSVEMSKKMQTDAKGAILEVLTALKGLDKEQQANVLSDLFGKESIGAIAPLLSNLEGLKENFNRVGDASQYSGSMLNEYAARAKTAKNSLELLQNVGTAASIAIGDAMLPTLKELAVGILPTVKAFHAFAKENQAAITIATQVVGVLAGMVIVVNAVAAVVNSVNMIITGMKMVYNGAKIAIIAYKESQIAAQVATARSVIASRMAAISTQAYAAAVRVAQAAQWLFNAALSANPIGVVIMGLVALGAAVYWCYQNFEQIQSFCTSMWESPAAAVLAFIAGPIGWLMYLGMGIIANWDAVKQWFITLWEDPGAAIDQFIAFASGKLSELYQKAQDIWQSIKAVFKDPIQAVVNFVKGGDVEAAAAAGQPIPGNAAGGIYGRGAFLTTFAENSPEAAIPINGTDRAARLWTQTGQMMGLLPKSVGDNAGKGTSSMLSSINRLGGNRGMPEMAGIQVSYNPQITIAGNADAANVQRVMDDERGKLEDMLERIARDRRRMAFD
ncbi:phage tail tape measure protein [uncultured Megasphaera sp.]|uniref:phage tail tape measure protein n=1 Tax=uncultured Megasphaera sp. TaxID=165188 RepID=UPI00266C3B98|nr:phage tail tape measure protein [uncultured Megasphaera sp.]